MNLIHSSRARLLLCLAALGLSAATAAHAQGTKCSITSVEVGLRGRSLDIQYTLQPSPGVCRVVLNVLRDGRPRTEVTLSGNCDLVEVTGEKDSRRTCTVRFGYDLDLRSLTRQDAGGAKVLELGVAGAPQEKVRVEIASVAQALRWQFGGGGFTSIEPRTSTPSLGQQQASGPVMRLGFPGVLAKSLELGFELSLATRQAIDSALLPLASERRAFKDTILAAELGVPLRLGKRVELVPIGGAGFAFLNTRRYRYTVTAGTVQTAEETQQSVAAALTAGVDLRAAIAPGMYFVAGDRIHMLLGPINDFVPRTAVQHRPAIGLLFKLGGLP